MGKLPRVVTKQELMEMMAVGKDKVNSWIGNGMPFFRIGEGKTSAYRFDVDRVLEWLHERYGEGGESVEEVKKRLEKEQKEEEENDDE